MPFLIERGVALVIECEPRLLSLMACSFRARVIPKSTSPMPETQSTDITAKADFVDLAETLIRHPNAFQRHGGYLKPDAARVAQLRDKWLRKAAGHKVIGLIWASARVRLGPARNRQN